MPEQLSETTGDFVRVATCGSPTEAHLLKGVLEASGLTPRVADANTVQANTWMTQAVGGVRVLVPAPQAESAHRVIAEFNAGQYQLEDPETPVAENTAVELKTPVFSPDRAVLLSFLLTPVFGAAVQLVNAAALQPAARSLGRWAWLAFLGVASLVGVAVTLQMGPDPFVVFRVSLALSFITVVWYFLAGQAQSKQLIAVHGPKYPKRSLVKPALGVAIAELILGWGLSELVA